METDISTNMILHEKVATILMNLETHFSPGPFTPRPHFKVYTTLTSLKSKCLLSEEEEETQRHI